MLLPGINANNYAKNYAIIMCQTLLGMRLLWIQAFILADLLPVFFFFFFFIRWNVFVCDNLCQINSLGLNEYHY